MAQSDVSAAVFNSVADQFRREELRDVAHVIMRIREELPSEASRLSDRGEVGSEVEIGDRQRWTWLFVTHKTP